MIVETSFALGVLTLALMLVYEWWSRRVQSAERRSRPKALAHAKLVYIETLFRIRDPIRLVAKVDRAYRLPNGSLVLVELKTRQQDRPYPSDIIQLSAQRLAIEGQTGEVVEPYAFVSLLGPDQRYRSHRVRLMGVLDLVALEQRRRAILSMKVMPAYAFSEAACRNCAMLPKCDRS